VLYLLHFDQPLGNAKHYLGVTGEDRLRERLKEHAEGRGAALTRAVFKRGIKVYLARVFPELGYEQEKRMKANISFKNVCPLCCPLLEGMRAEYFEVSPARPDQPPERAIWDNRPPLSFPPSAPQKRGPA